MNPIGAKSAAHSARPVSPSGLRRPADFPVAEATGKYMSPSGMRRAQVRRTRDGKGR
jgi:hypothetical protein